MFIEASVKCIVPSAMWESIEACVFVPILDKAVWSVIRSLKI